MVDLHVGVPKTWAVTGLLKISQAGNGSRDPEARMGIPTHPAPRDTTARADFGGCLRPATLKVPSSLSFDVL